MDLIFEYLHLLTLVLSSEPYRVVQCGQGPVYLDSSGGAPVGTGTATEGVAREGSHAGAGPTA